MSRFSWLGNITYKDGRKDIFNEDTLRNTDNHQKALSNPSNNANEKLTSKFDGKFLRNANAFVVSLDKGAIIHGQDALRAWNYWHIIENREDADIIVDFKIHRVFSYSFEGYAEVIDAKTHEVLLKTSGYNTAWKLNNNSFNGKKVVIERLVENRLKPIIDPDK